jgi:carbonic anhydrase
VPLVSNVRRRAVLGDMAKMAACSCCMLALSPRGAAADGGHFDYGPQVGQMGWKGVCATGGMQSPVNIPISELLRRPSANTMVFDYTSLKDATVVNSGHGAQVNVAPGNIMAADGQRWQMVQYHFHSPSEHSIGGWRADMELHLVHKSLTTGQLGVVGILLQSAGAGDGEQGCPALQQALKMAPAKVGSTSGRFTLAADTFSSLLLGSLPAESLSSLLVGSLAPGQKSTKPATALPHMHYTGSLTTPPCSEDVSWFVLLESRPVNASQVLRFQRFLGANDTLNMNSRYAQDMNGRIFDYERAGIAGS